MDELIYYVNSKGKKTVISSKFNKNYWEIGGRSGFAAADVQLFTQQMASGSVKYFGKALKPRTGTFQMLCKGASSAERDRIFGDMLDVLLDVNGMGEGRLYIKKSDGLMVYLRCVYSGGMNIVDQYKKFRRFKLEFYASDPTYYFDGTVYNWKNDGLNSTSSSNPGRLTIVNNSNYDTVFKMILFDFTTDDPVEGATPQADSDRFQWSLSGTFINETTGKKITFRNVDDKSEQIYNAKPYRLVVDLRKQGSEIYLEDKNGKREVAKCVDFENTDLDFCAINGSNSIVSHVRLSDYIGVYSKLAFPKVCYGV